MSLAIARQINAEFPEYLLKNIGESCHWYTVKLIERLRADGRQAYHICKTHGEGQYTPPGFQPRTVIGLDGKPYVCTGVSHDAIWCDDEQVDTAARANDSDEPITDSNGNHLTAVPVWNVIPKEFWRAHNPPLKTGAVVVNPPAPKPQESAFPYPDENTHGLAFQAGVKRAYNDAGRPFPDPNDSDAFRHFIRLGYSFRVMPPQQAIDKHLAELRAQLGV